MGTIGYDWVRVGTVGYGWVRLGTIGHDLVTTGYDDSSSLTQATVLRHNFFATPFRSIFLKVKPNGFSHFGIVGKSHREAGWEWDGWVGSRGLGWGERRLV